MLLMFRSFLIHHISGTIVAGLSVVAHGNICMVVILKYLLTLDELLFVPGNWIMHVKVKGQRANVAKEKTIIGKNLNLLSDFGKHCCGRCWKGVWIQYIVLNVSWKYTKIAVASKTNLFLILNVNVKNAWNFEDQMMGDLEGKACIQVFFLLKSSLLVLEHDL